MNEHKFYIGDVVRYDGGWGKVYDVGPVLPYARYCIEPHDSTEMVELPESALQLCCANCGSVQIECEDYVNPCRNAGCVLNGPVTYHLGCGSQHREYCADCGALLYDSAQDEIDNAEWEKVEYTCRQCEENGIQPGHFACGKTFYVPA